MLDSEAAGSLAKCLSKMPSLQRLDVSENPLQDAGIRYKHCIPSLNPKDIICTC